MGPTLGNGGGEGVARHAEERRLGPRLFRRERADPLGRRHRTRLSQPELVYLSPGAVARRQCAKGEHGTTVVYADRFMPDDEKQRARETGEEAHAIPFLKRFTVFNTAQCEGLPDDFAVAAPPPESDLIEPRVEALIKTSGIDFRIGGNRAFYVPAHDYVQVPPPQAYFEPINWHRTALHECSHASGAVHRLNRDLSGTFGTKKYAFEELMAEISAAFCCAALGIAPTVRHADYIGSWPRNGQVGIFRLIARWW